jgi:hypothetical protein
MQEGVQAMIVALGAVIIGVVFGMLGSDSIFIGIVGKMFIMGAFVIACTAFILFLREWALPQRE